MASPEKLDMDKMNEMIWAFNKESDRGAAILAGSFLEHYLGMFIQSKQQIKKYPISYSMQWVL